MSANEKEIQARIRLEASQKGLGMWRNNRGAVIDQATGTHVRFGLANDSKQMNDSIKSSDLIGIRPVLITPGHIGTIIGQFVSREVKPEGWEYRGTKREQAQLRWLELILSLGGDAAFATSDNTL